MRSVFDALDRLHSAAVDRYRGTPYATSVSNGYFLRDDVKNVTDARLSSSGASTVESDGQIIRNDEPSLDQIIGLMVGLVGVFEHSSDATLRQRASVWAGQLFDYLCATKFILKNPDGSTVKRGDDATLLSSLLHGLQKRVTGVDRLQECKIAVLGVDTSLSTVASFWHDNAPSLFVPAIQRGSLEMYSGGPSIELKSFSVHMVLLSIAMQSGVWTRSELDHAAWPANHQLSLALYDVHVKNTGSLATITALVDSLASILQQCPDAGPSGDNIASTTWQKDNLYVRCLDLNDIGSSGNEYNGIDWLLMHNVLDLLVR